MEHNQSVQSQSLKPKIDTSKLRQNLENTESWDTLKRIYHHYHWLFLFSLLFVFLGSSAIALYSLGYVETAKRKRPEPLQAKIIKPISTEKDRENRIPMWAVVAIAVSCASGCLIVVRFLNRPISQPKLKQRLRSNSEKRALRHKYERQSKKLEPIKNMGVRTLTTSSVKKKTGQMAVKSPTLVTAVPPNSKLNPIHNQLQVANMADMPTKNPLPPLLQKPVRH